MTGGWKHLAHPQARIAAAMGKLPRELVPCHRPRPLIAADDTATAYGRAFDVTQHAAWPPEYEAGH